MKPTVVWTIITVVVIALCLVAFEVRDHFLPAEEELGDFTPPKETLYFDDGWSAGLIQVGEEMIEEKRHVPSGGGLFGMSGSSFSGSRSTFGIQQTYEGRNGVLTRLTFEGERGSLLLEVILRDAADLYPNPLKVLSDGGEIYSTSINSNSRIDDFSGIDAMLSPTTGAVLPDILFQVADSQGNWINGLGPFAFHEEDPDRRGAVVFPAWPHSVDELRFRAIRPGSEPLEFTFASPAPKSPPAVWASQPLPATITRPEFSFTLEGVTTNNRGNHPTIRSKTNITSHLTKNGQPVANAYDVRFTGLEGPHGATSANYLPDPEEKQLKLQFSAVPSQHFPVPERDALMVAELEVDANGKLKPATVVRGAGVGLIQVTVQWSPYYGNDRHVMELKWDGVWANESQEAAADRATGGWNTAQLYCFFDSQPDAIQRGDRRGSGSSGSGGRTDFDNTFQFEFDTPPAPGTVIRFGLAQPPASHAFDVIIDRSDVK
ncbi:hypothetical protein [Sulfuriroseicoccus oceanibius]|uniref:Uncharacterized protein n=1 Tax=Sulfuriroseicoccus oceanibius TaxID=2707525 RepID=A0A6B3LFE1_9BACT|nr:hypothetical protein [Sulfuriroseicoccus oceanibius]QQL45222.1 hypothetical protein G3M56_001140 [Sulfuriroseicoccus oceanibius]